METALIEHQKVGAIVENVHLALADVQQGFELLQAAKTRLHATLGHDRTYYDNLWDHSHSLSDFDLDREAKASVQHITKNAWRYVVAQTGITAYMTEARAKQLREQIEKGELPELTVDNIMSTVRSLAERTPELLTESIREVFDWLRPCHDWGTGALKTNKKFRIGPKVIIGWAVERWSGPFRINYRYEDRFRSLGNVFSLLDGQGVEQYPHDLKTRLNQGFKQGATVEDQYFKCTAYKNRNLHITFKRQDLVDQINKIAGDMQIGNAA